MKFKITNRILIPLFFFLMLVFAALWFLFKDTAGSYASSSVYIRKASKVVEKIEINQLKEDKYEVSMGTNTVCITRSGVYMKKANCPDELCMHAGTIDKPGQSIVCLPNKIMVEIVGEKDGVDAVAGAR